MPAKVKYKALHDSDWLQARFVDDGLTRRAIAELVGCSDTAVARALRGLGIERPGDWRRPAPNGAMAPAPPTFDAIDLELAELVNEHRHGPAPAEREFVPTLPDARARAHNVDSEVPAAELRHRAQEGLEVLAALMDGLGTIGEAALFDHVMERLEPAQARIAVFAAAVVAQEQARLVDSAIG